MQRNLKVLGLALAAAFALSAVAASVASAVTHTFHSEVEVTHLTAAAENHQVFRMTVGDEQKIACGKVNVSGTRTGTEVGEDTFAANEVTVEPSYSECGVYNGAGPTDGFVGSATIDTNGCHYTFTGETDKAGHAFVHLQGCETETGITVTVSALNRPCLHITNNQTLDGVHYKNQETENGKEDVTVEATVIGIHSETTHFGLVCPTETGETETHDGGIYTGNISATGYSDEAHENQVNFTIK